MQTINIPTSGRAIHRHDNTNATAQDLSEYVQKLPSYKNNGYQTLKEIFPSIKQKEIVCKKETA